MPCVRSGFVRYDEANVVRSWPCCIDLRNVYVTKDDASWVHRGLDIGNSFTELWATGVDSDAGGTILGNAGDKSCYVFFNLDGSINWKSMATLYYVNHAVRKDGTMWTWGDDTSICWGSLGNNNSAVTRYSTPIQVVTGTTWTCVTGSIHTVAALRTDNTLWMWGYNAGMLGNNATPERSSPVQVVGTNLWTKVCVGQNSVIGLAIDGSAWTWGSAQNGQLGNSVSGFTAVSTPVQVCGMTCNVKEVYAGTNANFALKTDGTLWAWGSNVCGQLGNGSTTGVSTPIQIGSGICFVQLAPSINCNVNAIDHLGNRYVWGKNGCFNFGDGSSVCTDSYCVPTLADNIKWMRLTQGLVGPATFGIALDGSLWGWGRTQILGLDVSCSTVRTSTPVQVGTDRNWISINSGSFFQSYGMKQGKGGFLV